jgi:hypothetical protein
LYRRLLPLLVVFLILILLIIIIYLWLQKASEPVRNSVIAGILSNLITTSAFTIIGIGTFIGIFAVERQQLFRFFGINHNTPTIHIYLSRLEVVPGGTKGAEPIKIGYIGPTLIRIEYLAGLLVRHLFRSRILALIPKTLKDLLSTIHISLSDIDPIIDVSPAHVAEGILSENLILIGSGVYNYLSLHYLKQDSSPYYFGKNTRGERVVKVRRDVGDLELEGRAFNQELAIIQRINDNKHGTTVFICAGLGSSASYGSVRYLVQNWRKLYRKYGLSEFASCLVFENQPPDSESVVEPKRLHEVPMALP